MKPVGHTAPLHVLQPGTHAPDRQVRPVAHCTFTHGSMHWPILQMRPAGQVTSWHSPTRFSQPRPSSVSPSQSLSAPSHDSPVAP